MPEISNLKLSGVATTLVLNGTTRTLGAQVMVQLTCGGVPPPREETKKGRATRRYQSRATRSVGVDVLLDIAGRTGHRDNCGRRCCRRLIRVYNTSYVLGLASLMDGFENSSGLLLRGALSLLPCLPYSRRTCSGGVDAGRIRLGLGRVVCRPEPYQRSCPRTLGRIPDHRTVGRGNRACGDDAEHDGEPCIIPHGGGSPLCHLALPFFFTARRQALHSPLNLRRCLPHRCLWTAVFWKAI